MEGIEQQSRVDGKQILLIVLIVLVGLGLIGGGVWVSQKALANRNKKTESPAAVTPVVTETVEKVEVTPTPVLVRSSLKVEILNGSGIPGLAAKASLYLEELGYQGLKTANAAKYDYATTVIQIKEDKSAYTDMVKEDVGKKYTLASEIEILEKKSEFDVVIILGKK